MAKYLVKGSYSAAGAKGLIKEGGSSRKAAVDKMVKALGGSVECFYYAFGETDVYVIVDVPDAVSATAVSLAVNSTGSVALTSLPLMTVEEMDAACAKTVDYRPPGS